MKVNNFDVLKRMSAENMRIQASPAENITNLSYSEKKKGTKITIGVDGNVIHGIMFGETSCMMLLFDRAQFDELKKTMENEA